MLIMVMLLLAIVDIVSEPFLKKLFLKGPKYREPKSLDWEKARISIESGISECASDWCQKKGFHDNYLLGWRKEVMNLVNERINVLKTQNFEQQKERLSHFSSRECPKNLQ